jgi:subtilisin family serine protease
MNQLPGELMMKISRGWALSAALVAAALVLSFYNTPAGSAQESGVSPELVQPADLLVQGGLDSVAIDAFALRGGEIDIVIELNEEPTAKVYSKALARGRQEAGRQRGGDTARMMPEVARQANAEARAQLDRISKSQRSVLARLRAPGVNGKIIFQTQRVFNGFGARVDAASLEQIRALPEVKAIHELVPNTLDDTLTTKFIKAPEAWVSRPSGNAGEGVKIGIIDTGIDYLHTSMGGPGTGYAANNTNTIGDVAYPSAKVVGGWDFVGDAYTGAAATIAPDADPMDCNGHGSHVAGTAAGLGVNANGTTFAGPYDGSVPFNSLRIGPGVAPKAELYALKVFGCSGSTGVTPQAIEWAVDPNKDGDFSDRLDVINMSLGSPFGTSFDASAVASDNAVLAGVVVVASAGNSGDTHYITGSPGSSGRAISVAASNGDGFNAVRINGPAAVAGFKPVGLGTRPALTDPGVTGNVVLALDAANTAGPTTTDACSPLTNAAAVSGQIALLDRGTCSFDIKVKNAQNAGARGVIVADNAPGLPIGMTISDVTITIPSVRVTQADGNALKANLAGLNATIALTQFVNLPEAGDTLGSFSSRGVRRGDNVLKPDVTAPGVAITSTASGTGSLGRDLQGTSMAAPHVAGAMALLRQLHPDWSVEELKALVMNTATQDLFASVGQTGNRYGVGRIGAGRVNMQNASSNEVVAMNADGGGFVNLSFGSVEVLGNVTREKTVRVVNRGAAAQTYTLSYATITDVPGVTYTFPDGNTLAVGPGETKTFRVQLSANAALMKHTRDLTMAATQGNAGATNPRHWLSEAAGYVLLTPESGRALRVSAHAFTRPASGMTTTQRSLLLTSPTGSAALNLTGQDVNTGAAIPTDERSFVTAFELAATSPDEPNNLNLRNNADLRAVGVVSDARNRANFADTLISFGVATHGKWTTMFDVEFDIYIDTNLDGVDDYVLFNTATVTGTAPNTNRNDVPVVQLNKLSAPGAGPVAGSLRFVNGFSAATLNTVPYNTNVMAMTVNAGHLGLTAANSRFRYRVLAFDRNTASAVDVISGLTYDAAKPGLSFTGTLNASIMPSYFDFNGGAIPFNYNVADFKAAGSKGVLLLHHHNTDGNREQVLPFAEPAATTTTVAAAAGQYSDQVALTATVGPTTLLDHTAAGSVTFSVNGSPVGSAPIDAGGVATLPYTVAQPAGVHNVTAAFASTSPAFLGSNGASTLTVSKESAAVTPSASNPASVRVNTAGGTAGPITLSAQIVETADGSLGDIANASPVTFTLTPVGPGSAITQTATLSGSGAGPLTASVTLTNVPVNVYDVTINVGGNYYAGSGSTVLAVFDPSLGNVTGGGTIIRNGVRANFGFNIKYLKNGNAQGQLLYVEHRPEGAVKVKSNAMGTVSVAGDTAIILGKATLGEIGNYSFRATVVDKGEPGTGDQFGLQLTSPAGAQVSDLWFSPVILSGGNVQVPGNK